MSAKPSKHLVELHVPWGSYATPELRELDDFQYGPYELHESMSMIVDRAGEARFSYLYPIPSQEADGFLAQLNEFYALWLLAKPKN